MSGTALLTGASGFIGARLARRLLADGWTVHAIIRPTSDRRALAPGMVVHVHDGTVAGLIGIVEAARPDIVMHLASLFVAEHQPPQVDALVDSNVRFPAQLAEAMVRAGVARLLNTGTAWQHFGGGEEYRPANLYAATKQAAEALFRYYHDAHGVSVLSLKLFDTYGPGDPRRKLVQLLVDAAQSGEPLGMSPGEQIVDLTHVDDVVEAFLVAAARLLEADEPVEESFFVSGERLRVRELVELVGQVMGAPLQVEFGARPYRAREVMEPVRPAGEAVLPGWRRRRSLRTSLTELGQAP